MLPNIRWYPISVLAGIESKANLVTVILCNFSSKYVELGYWNGKKFVNQNKRPFRTKFTHFAVVDLPSEPTQDSE